MLEVSKSNTATRLGIDNTPKLSHLTNMKLLCENVFEPLREWAGVPIRISSGYRSEALNKAIGGSPTSQHCFGMALDLDNDGSTVTNKMIFDYIRENLDFDQLLWEFGTENNPDWVHVSYSKGNNRKQVLEAYKEGGKTKYRPYK
jgi:hypothetical protein